MKIVIAPDSYEESLSALEVATQIEKGFREVFPDADYVKLPAADGGEGAVEATGGEIIRVQVTGPLGKPVEAFFGLSGDPIGFGGSQLTKLARIGIGGLDARIRDCRFEVACDVSNPLTGDEGASAVFGPQ